MNQSKISVRYAKALFQLSVEKDKLEDVRRDVLLICKALDDYEQLRKYIDSPVVKPSQKNNLLNDVFSGTITKLSLQFLGLLVKNKREKHLRDIARQFLLVYGSFKGIKLATITTAVLLDDSIRVKLYHLLSSVYNTEIDLQTQIKPSILGGFVLKVGDQQYDASIANGLSKIKATLLNESV
jgi:F-type H+-transporting ATPase subunit delta